MDDLDLLSALAANRYLLRDPIATTTFLLDAGEPDASMNAGCHGRIDSTQRSRQREKTLAPDFEVNPKS